MQFYPQNCNECGHARSCNSAMFSGACGFYPPCYKKPSFLARLKEKFMRP